MILPLQCRFRFSEGLIEVVTVLPFSTRRDLVWRTFSFSNKKGFLLSGMSVFSVFRRGEYFFKRLRFSMDNNK